MEIHTNSKISAIFLAIKSKETKDSFSEVQVAPNQLPLFIHSVHVGKFDIDTRTHVKSSPVKTVNIIYPQSPCYLVLLIISMCYLCDKAYKVFLI